MNVEKLIKITLLNNDLVYNSLAKTIEGIPLINPLRVPEGNFPLIEFHQISGGDGLSADDNVYTERYTFQVTLIAEDELYLDLRECVKESLRDVGFRVINEYNSKNSFTNKVHYSIHIRQSYESVWYKREMTRQELMFNEKYPDEGIKIPDGTYYDPETGEEYEYIDDELPGNNSNDEILDEEDLKDYEFLP